MIFFERLLQENAREQQMPLHVAFVDLTTAFDYVNREALFTILKKVGCPPIKSFHENMQGTAQVDGMLTLLTLVWAWEPDLMSIYFLHHD